MTPSETQLIRKIIHVDMDAFYASVEQRDEPSYRGRPLVVGGSPEQRGVVAAASYEARRFGIHSAMPSRTAVQRCPHLIFVAPRFAVYREVSDQIHDIFHDYTDLVEPLALDEAYLDVTSNKPENPSATLIAREIKKRILDKTDLTASAGVSVNKFLAKVASGVNKPNGLTVIPPEKAAAFLENLPIEEFYGVGKVTAQRMEALGIFKGADLKQKTEEQLKSYFGKTGSFYYQIVRGVDNREVVPNRVPKSIGAEESFADDLNERAQMLEALRELGETVIRRLAAHETSGKTLTLKVKYADYQQVTRSKTWAESITGLDQILVAAGELLNTTAAQEKQVRLLGLQVSNLDCAREHEEPQYVQLTLAWYANQVGAALVPLGDSGSNSTPQEIDRRQAGEGTDGPEAVNGQ